MEQLDIKLPVTMELKVRVNFFGTKIRAFSEAKAQQNSYIPNNYTVPLANINLPLVTKLAKQDSTHLYTIYKINCGN